MPADSGQLQLRVQGRQVPRASEIARLEHVAALRRNPNDTAAEVATLWRSYDVWTEGFGVPDLLAAPQSRQSDRDQAPHGRLRGQAARRPERVKAVGGEFLGGHVIAHVSCVRRFAD